MKIISCSLIAILLIGAVAYFDIRPAKAEGAVYIRADGSVDPPTAPILSVDNVTFILTADFASSTDGLVSEKSDIVIDGNNFKLRGEVLSNIGIKLSGVNNVTVKKMTVEGFSYCFYMTYANGNVFSEISFNSSSSYSSSGCLENSLSNSFVDSFWTKIGVTLDFNSSFNCFMRNNMTDGTIYVARSSNNNSITDNCFVSEDSYGHGITLWDSSNNLISRNTFLNGGLSLQHHFDGAVTEECIGNIVENNTVNGRSLVYLESTSDQTINEAGQIVLAHCNGIKVANLDLFNTPVCLQLYDTNSSEIFNCTMNRSDVGLYLTRSNNNTIASNVLAENSFDGMFVGYSSNNSILKNMVFSNKRTGILFTRGNSYNLVSGNEIVENGYANYNYESAGIWLLNSSYNCFYHNNLVNNTMPIYDRSWNFSRPPSVNSWDCGYPTGGNYFSNCDSVDLYFGTYQNVIGSDGISDVPYVIDENNMDNYPLMGPWTRTGENVTVAHATGVALTFENITDPGITTVNQTSSGPDPPSGFELATDPPVYYEIETTANYSGIIKIVIPYNDTGLTQEQENTLKLMHWNHTAQEWINITTSVDTENNVIYGETDSFSLFALITSIPYGPGDINKDKIVDIFDVTIVALAFSSTPSDPNWNTIADINNDEIVDIFDLVVVALHFGETI